MRVPGKPGAAGVLHSSFEGYPDELVYRLDVVSFLRETFGLIGR